VKIGVVGHLGVVGGAVARGLARIGHAVGGWDLRDPRTSVRDVADAEVIFVCVPTPARPDGACDVSRVAGVVDRLADAGARGVVAIKSTVPPGTTAALAETYPRLRLAHCPEFLRERAADVDFVEHHDVCVIGARADADFAAVAAAHGHLPRKVARMTPTESELCKYFGNALNALRVVFANEFYELCAALGADYAVVKGAMVHRANIPDAYLDVSEAYRGFGGMCLPKDTAALAAIARELAPAMKLFEVIVEENKKFRTTVPEGMRP